MKHYRVFIFMCLSVSITFIISDLSLILSIFLKIKITLFSAFVSINGLKWYADVLNDLYLCKYFVFCECSIHNVLVIKLKNANHPV